jgi:Uma2 family endonuclease
MRLMKSLLNYRGFWATGSPSPAGSSDGIECGFCAAQFRHRAPDVSFVKAERLRRSPRSFAELAPDLMVEVKSPTDSVAKLRDKIQEFLVLGTQVGILIN